jgi:hypothetical protein
MWLDSFRGLLAQQTVTAKNTEVPKLTFLGSSLWELIHTNIDIFCVCNGDRT